MQVSTRVTPQKIIVTKLQAARGMVARDSPYLQVLLWAIVYKKVTAEELGRMAGLPGPLPSFAITNNGVLLYTQEALDAWTERQIAGAIEHELWHLLSDHAMRTGSRDPHLANVAKDIAINGMLKAGGRELPKTECLPETWGFPTGKMWEEYYELLEKHPKVQEARGKGRGEGDRSKESFGQCGSGAGNALPNEPQSEPGQGQGQGESQGEGQGQGDNPYAGRSQDDLAHARRQCAAALAEEANRDGGRGIGHLPGGLLRAVDQLIKPPSVPWHQKLARRLRRGTSTGPGMVDYSYDRPSRRMAALQISGRRAPLLPRMVAPTPRVLVAIDTSGSMGEDALLEAMSEVDGIFRAAQGRVAFCSCDTRVQSSGRGASWRDVARELRGGGGTCISPIFDHVEEKKREERPNLLVVFTDGGFSDCPETAPHGVEVVWVLVGSYKCRDTTNFGDVIEVEEEEGAED